MYGAITCGAVNGLVQLIDLTPTALSPTNAAAPASAAWARHRPDRSTVVLALNEALVASDESWAFLGARRAVTDWMWLELEEALELWVSTPAAPAAYRGLARLGGVMESVASSHAGGRTELWRVGSGARTYGIRLAVGNLATGHLELCQEPEIASRRCVRDVVGLAGELLGPARVLDLLVRPLWEGRMPGGHAVVEARAEWAVLDREHRSVIVRRVAMACGRPLAAEIVGVLEGRALAPELPARCEMRAVGLDRRHRRLRRVLGD